MKKFVLFLVFGFVLSAKWSSFLQFNIDTILITADQEVPYKLSRVVSIHGGNTLSILLPPKGVEKMRVYGPSRTNTLLVENIKLFDFINFIRPKRVILLGNENLVPYQLFLNVEKNKKYFGKLLIYLVDDNNWTINSWELAEIYNNPEIATKFRELTIAELRQFEINSKVKRIASTRKRFISVAR